jgi:ABC-type lipoprotein export system ATPase subunit
MTAKLSTRGLSKSFRKGAELIEVLRDLDIDIGAGEFASIAGP